MKPYKVNDMIYDVSNEEKTIFFLENFIVYNIMKNFYNIIHYLYFSNSFYEIKSDILRKYYDKITFILHYKMQLKTNTKCVIF